MASLMLEIVVRPMMRLVLYSGPGVVIQNSIIYIIKFHNISSYIENYIFFKNARYEFAQFLVRHGAPAGGFV